MRPLLPLLLAQVVAGQAAGDGDDAASLAAQLGSITAGVVQEHESLLAMDADVSSRQQEERPYEAPLQCSREGFLRALHDKESLWMKPWELCPGCDGDLTKMMDIRCFEKGTYEGVAETVNLENMDPRDIRPRMEQPNVRAGIDDKEKFSENPAQICLVGCKSGFRPSTSIQTAYLVYPQHSTPAPPG